MKCWREDQMALNSDSGKIMDNNSSDNNSSNNSNSIRDRWIRKWVNLRRLLRLPLLHLIQSIRCMRNKDKDQDQDRD